MVIDEAADMADAAIIQTPKIATAVHHWLYEIETCRDCA